MIVIECPHCASPVLVERPASVRFGHSESSGRPREWVLREGGDEIHRCPESTRPLHTEPFRHGASQ
jgi:hypothetical protein